VLYTDPLLPPAEWPGVLATYRFAGSPPRLLLSLVFDPARVTDGEDAAEQRVEAALLRYATVVAQLADPGTRVEVVQSVLPADGGAVGDGAAIRTALAGFAAEVVAQLQAALAGGTAAPVPLEVAVPLDPGGLASRADDVFPVSVSLTLSRVPERVDPRARAWMPGAVSAATAFAPELDPPAEGTAGDPPPADAGLTRFAAGFEAAFAGFDGAGGAARLAVRSDAPAAHGLAASPSPWGVRWSTGHGIHAAFRKGEAACFTLAPLGTDLVDGVAQVPTYDSDSLEPTYAPRSFSGVDLDAWARTYLEAMDEVLSPAIGAAIAVLDGASHRALVDARSQLAAALAGRLVPVFPAVPGGDLGAARDRFEQDVLASLSSACAVSSVVQVPADVAVAGAGEPGAAAPRLVGSVGEPGTDGAAGREHTLGEGTLPVRATAAESPAHLTFPVTAARPGQAAGLTLDLRWRPHTVEHLPGVPEAAYGYAAPERLRFVLDAPDAPLDLPLGTVNVPVPARAFPAAPVPQEQRAEQSPGDGPASAAGPPLLWDYTATLAHTGPAAQDQLWVSVAYDLPLDGPASRLHRAVETPETVRAMFEALASFGAAWPVLQPHVAALPRALSGGDGSPAPARVVAALLEQVQPVVWAWRALRGAGEGGIEPVPGAPPAADTPPPVGDTYVLSFADAFTRGVLRVFARARPAEQADGGCDEAGIVWPLVDGRASGGVAPAGAGAPDAGGCWFAAEYAYAPPSDGAPGALELTWPRLDASARQTARATFRTVRNAGLRPGAATAPELVRRTAPTSFASPVAPAIVVTPRSFAPGAGLAATLEEALQPFAVAGSALGGDRRLRLAMTYRFPVGQPDGGDPAMWSELPVLMAPDVLLATGSGGDPSGPALTLRQLAAKLAAEADAWYGAVQPSAGTARLGLDATLSAGADGARHPVVHAPESVIEVPAGWWPAGDAPAGGVGRRSGPE
jgi:hypothetical protein